MTEIPDSLPPDPTPAERSRSAEADMRLARLGVEITGPNRHEIAERIHRLVVELIEARDSAAVLATREAARFLRLAASAADLSSPAHRGAFLALQTAAESLEATAWAVAVRFGLTAPEAPTVAAPPPPPRDASGSSAGGA